VAGLRYCDKFWIYVAISGNRSRRWYVAKLIRGDQIDDVRCFVLLGVHEAAAVDCSLITHRAAGTEKNYGFERHADKGAMHGPSDNNEKSPARF